MGRENLVEMNDLTQEQRQLVDAYMTTRSFIDAYRIVYPDCDTVDVGTTVYYRASKAFNNRMRDEIKRRDDIAEKAERKEIERAAKEAAKRWTKVDSVESLVDVVQLCRKQIKEDSERGEGINTKVADTMRGTIDTLNKMLGYNEPDKQTVDSVVEVVFGVAKDADGGDSLEDFAE